MMTLTLNLPALSDEAIAALHDFLLDTVTQFENQYFAQLHRYRPDLDEECHRPLANPIDPSPDSDQDVPF